MDKDFAKEIESRKSLIGAIGTQMEKVRADFIEGIRPFVQEWLQAIARQYVERSPQRALQLGKERLTLLKARVHQLCEEAGAVSREVFSKEAFWPESRELVTQNQLGIRVVFGKLGSILQEFGFVKTKAQTEEDLESWDQYDCSGDRREFDGTPVYPHSVELPGAMKILLEEYQILIRKKSNLREEIKRLEFEALQAQATRLWDDI
ncbi:MAG: hypothetical protein GX442_17945 [Candidatus Riflebacteria bacterium]|nr:hypothetical protein [Candidatus Riflebacteria bacterium]